MNNGQSPATKQDLADLRTELKQDLAAQKKDLLEAIREANDQLKVELKEELLEAMHDIETHLLKAFYGYTESTQRHLKELDRAHISVHERLSTLEDRIQELERRINFPRFNP